MFEILFFYVENQFGQVFHYKVASFEGHPSLIRISFYMTHDYFVGS